MVQLGEVLLVWGDPLLKTGDDMPTDEGDMLEAEDETLAAVWFLCASKRSRKALVGLGLLLEDENLPVGPDW